jgi:hypothetical protein
MSSLTITPSHLEVFRPKRAPLDGAAVRHLREVGAVVAGLELTAHGPDAALAARARAALVGVLTHTRSLHDALPPLGTLRAPASEPRRNRLKANGSAWESNP